MTISHSPLWTASLISAVLTTVHQRQYRAISLLMIIQPVLEETVQFCTAQIALYAFVT